MFWIYLISALFDFYMAYNYSEHDVRPWFLAFGILCFWGAIRNLDKNMDKTSRSKPLFSSPQEALAYYETEICKVTIKTGRTRESLWEEAEHGTNPSPEAWRVFEMQRRIGACKSIHRLP